MGGKRTGGTAAAHRLEDVTTAAAAFLLRPGAGPGAAPDEPPGAASDHGPGAPVNSDRRGGGDRAGALGTDQRRRLHERLRPLVAAAASAGGPERLDRRQAARSTPVLRSASLRRHIHFSDDRGLVADLPDDRTGDV